MPLSQILKYQNFAKEEKKEQIVNKNIRILSPEESVENQFRLFLKGMRMEKYFDKFKENECCDMDSIELFDDDTLENEIGISSKIHRKKILKKCAVMKQDM